MPPATLIPNIALIEIDAVFAQQPAIFFLERPRPMMFFLLVDVFQRGLKLAWTHRERAVAALPEKFAIPRIDSP